ncbi:MAG: Ppx/GppA phosphatase family protein, partial [Sphingomonadales bacterium]
MRPQLKFKVFSKRDADTQLIAVIDIGSNSVRLVVFKGLKRSPQILFNERVLCGLGRSISKTGCMDDEAIEKAVLTLKRFAFLCDDMEVDEVEVIATSAVRDAKNGSKFSEQILKECGFNINTISGKEEANLSALAVISGFPNVTGIVGDLGGGSLELAFINNDEIIDEISLPIGPLRFLNEKLELSWGDKTTIKNYINSVPWLKCGKGHPFYMVGGTWRLLSKLH